ncbi:MAG TPA: hypothetical protein VN634_08595 [Candidatus Limnocylindrales bacterium]|nr:hypothetical protein [Candidatus Limnocylindrales bacterium]
MAFVAMVMFVLTLIAFAYGALGYAGMSAEIGWLFGLLALTFLVAAARLDKEMPFHGRVADHAMEANSFGPNIRMKMVPVAASGAGPSADGYSE